MLIPGIACAQQSVLYNSHRQLIADTSFVIDKKSFSNLPLFEKEILPRIYNNVKYPARLRYNGVNGSVVAKLVISGDSLSFRIMKSSYDDFNLPVSTCLKNLSRYIQSGLFPKKEMLSFYVPIKFEVILNRYQETLKKNKMITIEAYEEAPVIYEVN
ncbi:hypothetical protein GCM10022392_33750 [Mucilaginibacter panaciglaebae]|uniref:TonB-like protein n=2 Tax=Mucilaginibacter panaciglaebae TaxID=502331 RepID=A0ABP7X5Z5_9SPHI